LASAAAFHLHKFNRVALDCYQLPKHGFLKQQVQECFHLTACLRRQRQRFQPFSDFKCFDGSQWSATPFGLDVPCEIAAITSCRALGKTICDGGLSRFLFQNVLKTPFL
jgi:hypothetical protein